MTETVISPLGNFVAAVTLLKYVPMDHFKEAPMKDIGQHTIRKAVATTFIAAACSNLALLAHAQSPSPTPTEARQIAEDAYIYGYSLITTEVTRVQMTNVSKPEETHAPMNQFGTMTRYPPANYHGVSAPNADTLYSLAWLDLAEPQVFSHRSEERRVGQGGTTRMS